MGREYPAFLNHSNRVPETPDYLSFLASAETIDDLGEWLGGATVTGIYEFRMAPNEELVTLVDTDETQFIAPNLAAPENDIYKFLRTSDNKFLCHRGDS